MPIVRSPKFPPALDYSDFVLNFVKRLVFFHLLQWSYGFVIYSVITISSIERVLSTETYQLLSFALSYTIPRGLYDSKPSAEKTWVSFSSLGTSVHTLHLV